MLVYALQNHSINCNLIWDGDRLDREGDRLVKKGRGPTPGAAQTRILRFTMEIFIYKWLLLVHNNNNNNNVL